MMTPHPTTPHTPVVFGATPKLVAGAGRLGAIAEEVALGGFTSVVLVRGGSSVDRRPAWNDFVSDLRSACSVTEVRVSGEPTVEVVDSHAEAAQRADAVVAVGGGSVIDTAKALAATPFHPGSIADYLEGVGSRAPTGRRLPLFVAPTTAGTGSEATRNAVIRGGVGSGYDAGAGGNRRDGREHQSDRYTGYKKSLRHDGFVPDVVVLDPELAVGAPRQVTAAAGLDALTQLIEAYVSTSASPPSDAYAQWGLSAWARSLPILLGGGAAEDDAVPAPGGTQSGVSHSGAASHRAATAVGSGAARGTAAPPDELTLRLDAAYAAYCSGVCLANAGLGLVHGIAGPLGGVVDVPHGVACGLLLPPITRATIALLSVDDPAAARYAAVGYILGGVHLPTAEPTPAPEPAPTRVSNGTATVGLPAGAPDQGTPDTRWADHRSPSPQWSPNRRLSPNQRWTIEEGLDLLDRSLSAIASAAALGRLGDWGVDEGVVDAIAASISHKNAPVKLAASVVRAAILSVS